MFDLLTTKETVILLISILFLINIIVSLFKTIFLLKKIEKLEKDLIKQINNREDKLEDLIGDILKVVSFDMASVHAVNKIMSKKETIS